MKYTFICHTLDYGWRSTMGWWFSCTLQFFQAWFVIYCMMVCNLTNTITYKKININLLMITYNFLFNKYHNNYSIECWCKYEKVGRRIMLYSIWNQKSVSSSWNLHKGMIGTLQKCMYKQALSSNIFPITLLSNKSWFSIVCNKRWPGAT